MGDRPRPANRAAKNGEACLGRMIWLRTGSMSPWA